MVTFNNLSKQLEINHYQFLFNMKKLLKSLSIVCVLAIIVVSCTGGDSFLKEAEKGISAGDYTSALAAIDSALAKDPNNVEAYYLQGRVYGQIAQNNPDIQSRKEEYAKMIESFEKIHEIETDEKVYEVKELQIENHILEKWGKEHNAAVQFATDDPSAPEVENPLKLAEYHLINATTINSDSTLSYEVLSEVYRMQQNYAGAISSLKTAMSLKEKPEAYNYSNLASFYMMESNYDSAIQVLYDGLEHYPDSVDLTQKLADSYSNKGDYDNSIKTLESLLEREPDNPQYHLVLGTQVYIMASNISDEISAKYDQLFDLERDIRNLRGTEKADTEKTMQQLNNEIEEAQTRVDELTERAIKELNIVIGLRPDDASTYNTLGIVFQNKAAALFDKRNATSDNEEAAALDAQAKDELRKAMENYEKATELDPDNTDYWSALFRVYTSLGMNDKAEEAMKKAGM